MAYKLLTSTGLTELLSILKTGLNSKINIDDLKRLTDSEIDTYLAGFDSSQIHNILDSYYRKQEVDDMFSNLVSGANPDFGEITVGEFNAMWANAGGTD